MNNYDNKCQAGTIVTEHSSPKPKTLFYSDVHEHNQYVSRWTWNEVTGVICVLFGIVVTFIAAVREVVNSTGGRGRDAGRLQIFNVLNFRAWVLWNYSAKLPTQRAQVKEEDEMDMADPRRLGVFSNSAALGMVKRAVSVSESFSIFFPTFLMQKINFLILAAFSFSLTFQWISYVYVNFVVVSHSHCPNN